MKILLKTSALLLTAWLTGCSLNSSVQEGIKPVTDNSAAASAVSPAGDVVGKVTVGYQGWFAASGDGSPFNHFAHDNYENWPDVREYTNTYQTPYANLGNGQPAKTFSSYDQQVLNTHFKWMAQNGIDCAALQRFTNEITPGSTEKAQRDGVATRLMNAAQTNNRKFYIMYDLSGGTNFAQADWTNTIVNTLHLTNSAAYARQNGKPVVCLWGLGFTWFTLSPADAIAYVEFFKSQGCYVIGGLPGGWREHNGFARADYDAVYAHLDMIMPWVVGGIPDATWLGQELAYCTAHGIDYQADTYAGFSFNNSNSASPRNQFPRNHGDFMWRQFADIRQVGVQSAYVSMFDEINEGTAIFKCAEDQSMLPTNHWFLPLDADGVHVSSDFYLRLVNDGGRMMKGLIPYQGTHPTPHTLDGSTPALTEGTYRIVNVKSGLVLDAKDVLTANGTPIHQWPYSGGTNEQWVLTKLSANTYKLIGVQSGRALDVSDQSLAPGAAIHLWDYYGGNNQRWVLSPTPNGAYILTSVQSGLVMEVEGASITAGALVKQNTGNGGTHQQWLLQKL
jgi:hypothetical protein